MAVMPAPNILPLGIQEGLGQGLILQPSLELSSHLPSSVEYTCYKGTPTPYPAVYFLWSVQSFSIFLISSSYHAFLLLFDPVDSFIISSFLWQPTELAAQ